MPPATVLMGTVLSCLVACTGSNDDSSTPDSGPGDTGTQITAPDASWSDGIVEYQRTVSLGPGSTWTGIVADDDHLYVSLKDQDHLWLQVLDHDMNMIGDRVQLTFDSDVPADQKIADHKLLRILDRLFLAWNPNARNDLYLIAFDLEGTRLGNQATIEVNAFVSTADMHLLNHDQAPTLIYGDAGPTRWVAELDLDLNLVTPPFEVAMGKNLDQLGTTIYHQDRWYMFTGDETSENLTVSFFEKDWTPSDPSGKTLIQGQEGEWNWFPSGADRSRDFGVWANVYHNMPYQGTFADDATIELAVFDQNLEFSQHFDVGGTDYHAADVTSRNACLYVAVAWADVTIDQYRIKAPDGYEDGETTCGAAR